MPKTLADFNAKAIPKTKIESMSRSYIFFVIMLIFYENREMYIKKYNQKIIYFLDFY